MVQRGNTWDKVFQEVIFQGPDASHCQRQHPEKHSKLSLDILSQRDPNYLNILDFLPYLMSFYKVQC